MTQFRGDSNVQLGRQIAQHFSSSGLLRGREIFANDVTYDVNGPVVQLQKNQAVITGAGRLVILKGQLYKPAYTVGIGATPGSGYSAPSDGVYMVQAAVACSGSVIELFCGSVIVDGVPVSGTQSFSPAGGQGSTCLDINGLATVVAGQVINVAVKTVHGNLTTIGSEDLIHAPSANLIVYKMPSDQLTFNG